MNSFKTLLTQKLSEIQLQFTDFNPLYEFHKDSDTHFIVVEPKHLNANEEFETLCGDLLLDLMDLFPEESLAFITTDSLVVLNDAQLIFESALPEAISFNEDVIFVPASSNSFLHEHFRSEVISYNKIIPSNFDTLNPIEELEINPIDEMNYTMAA